MGVPEFAGHRGFTYARFLAQHGYCVVNVLPAHTKRVKELDDNSPVKTDAKDAWLRQVSHSRGGCGLPGVN